MTNKTGGPAFPLSAHPEHGYGPAESVKEGMTLWDYFAAHALSSFLLDEGLDFEECADRAAKSADAMIAEREKRGIK